MVDEFNETVGKEKGIFVESSSSGGVNELIESIQFELDKPEGRELPDIFGVILTQRGMLIKKAFW